MRTSVFASAAWLAALGVGLAQAPTRERVVFALHRADDQPLGRRVQVHLFDQFAESERTKGGVWSDGAGTVSLDALPCDRYDLWVECPTEGEPVAAALCRGLEVTAGDGPQTLDLKLPEPGSVSGRLLLADGKTPAQGCAIGVQSGTAPDSGDDPAAYARGALTCYAQARTGADGAFVLRGLTPGVQALDVRRTGEVRPWCTVEEVQVKAGETTDLADVILPASGWQHLLDGHTLNGWREGDFYGKKPVRTEGDRVVIPMGEDMTGITWAGDIPRVDYEVSLQAIRLEGSDFFCGLTFPVREDYCSLILGGWGGSVVGLSSLDYADAAENETTQWIQFKQRQWYRIRVRVTSDRISAWLDGKRIVDVATANRRISTRIECEPSKPFGIATWRTTGGARDIRVRSVSR